MGLCDLKKQKNALGYILCQGGHQACTLFESENERQKIEPVPIPFPRASRNFPNVKTKNEKNSIIGDNPIYPFWKAILKRQKLHFL